MPALIKSDATDLCQERFLPMLLLFLTETGKLLKSSWEVRRQRFLFSDSRNRGVGLLVGGEWKKGTMQCKLSTFTI